jgi:exosortase A
MLTATLPPAWRWPLPVLAGALLILLGLYWPTVVSMMAIWWRSETFAHGLLIVPISLYMITNRREQLAVLTPTGSRLGLVALLLLALGWLAAYSADVLVVQQFALVAMLVALVLALLGWRITWALAFPLAYLFFMVPVGEGLILPLQDFTALFTVHALRLTGIPVFWEGYFITIPTGDFEVAEACSGLRYLIASVALGCLYAYLTYHSLWRRLAFLVLAVVVPILANGVRAYGIVMLAYLSEGQLATGVDHLIYGWLFFGVVMLLMFWIGSFWRDTAPAPVPVAAEETTPVTAPAPASTRTGSLRVALLALAVAAVGPLGVAWLHLTAPAVGPVALAAPPAAPPWQGPVAGGDHWPPAFIGADGQLRQSYSLDGQTVDLYLAYYRQQRQGAELINSQNRLYDGKRWVYIGETGQTVLLAGGELAVRALRIAATGRQRLVWYWYWVGGWTTTSPITAKLLEAWDQLSGRHRGSALIAVATDYDIQTAEAEALLGQFLDTTAAGIQASLRQY